MKRRRWVIAGSVIGVFLAVAIAAVASIDALRWRLKVAWLVGTGQVTDLGLVETLPMLKPGSPYWLKGLPETRNPYASIRNPYASDADVAAGEKVFAHECASCHAPDTHGGQVAPTLIGRSYTYGDSDWAVFRTVQRGVPTTAMPPHDWPDTRIWQVIGYLRSINVIAAGQATAQAAASIPADFRVPYAAIAAQALPGGDWLTYSGSYTGARHSTLKEIDRASVGRLAPRWIHQFEIGSARIEMSPIVYRETMFVTYAGNVAALDARNGQRLWEYARAQPPDARVCCGVVNRGVAILDDRIFYATIDAHLIALSTRTGAKLWDVAVVPDYRAGYAITAAPLVIDGLVITGIAGGDFPTRGFLAAYDAATGTERWRFRTIPEPGEPGHDSWPGDSWRNGGGGTWLTGSYDPALDLVFWGVGNPAPDFNAAVRRGDNLYTCAVIALNAKTGKLAWHFQFTPNDDHDWDATQIPVLADRKEAEAPHQMLWANRNGFFYVLDRATGRFIRGAPFVPQTWAEGLDPKGRPMPRKGAAPSERGTLIYPSGSGATNWWSPSYDPELDLMLVPTLERGGVFFASGGAESHAGEMYLGSRAEGVEDLPSFTAVTAISPADGHVVWRNRREAKTQEELSLGGLLTTAGGLTFTSSGQDLIALDTRHGAELWRFHAGGRITAAPVTYLSEGRQRIAVSAGNVLIEFALVDAAAVSRVPGN